MPMAGFAQDRDDRSKTDLQLLEEAECIEKTGKNPKYGSDGKIKDDCAKNKCQTRHEEIARELDSRGIFHKNQMPDTSLAEYKIDEVRQLMRIIRRITVLPGPVPNTVRLKKRPADNYTRGVCVVRRHSSQPDGSCGIRDRMPAATANLRVRPARLPVLYVHSNQLATHHHHL